MSGDIVRVCGVNLCTYNLPVIYCNMLTNTFMLW